MNRLQGIHIPNLDEKMGMNAEKYVNSLTKPPGSLGRLEEVVIELAKMTGEAFPEISPPGVIVFAADHGITSEGVSAFPQEVTCQMVRNFLNGGAAINVFSRSINARLSIVDIGVSSDIEDENLVKKKVRYGTANFLNEDAMSPDEAVKAIEIGFELGQKMINDGAKCLILGEMGIGNTTTSSAVAAAISGKNIDSLVGIGTGIEKNKIPYKQQVIMNALKRRKPAADDPIDVLSKVGGLEIAGMAGAMLAAASNRTPILIDGFICATAALVAKLISNQVTDYMILGHRSVEPGHTHVMELLGKKPLLDLEMRLGEGTGAAVAFPILQSAVLMLKEMATFETAQISNKE
ncbi:nicotinate-nucleotide--dimethylbenzimidazole phosphoribosyltransferase [Domibacillus epiphyticus]|uniref:Nicotinate-nucleotide--dimethylbenzimidazole phosphoribosyltransferase n=2 Tax=Domibacillus epiphyticus TaxID=1714355 RepID=A0A1V2A7G2_9BACI|nr:nicotinate-nucleotide--dimethylbenzimidazole phosphoribosyltransferase [Domibacillus epiphyticus]OMP66939.1 nicotinate-nucleotide--dimethylbenzimidazole phosphoribosyltransferase [Domibacillus epiphyticus]